MKRTWIIISSHSILLALSYSRFLNSLISQPVNSQNGVFVFYVNKSYDTRNQIELEGDIGFENN